MKTTGREYFYLVSGLMPPKYMVNDKLEEEINNFIEIVPQNTEKLEQFANYNLDREIFVAEMEKLYMMLCTIYAHWLETEAARILRLIEVNESEICRPMIIPFVTNIRTLAIDIQMAQNKSPDVAYCNRDEIERYKDVTRSMSIIITLLNNSDYKKAFDIAKSVHELQNSEYIMPLISHITSQNNKQALSLANEIKSIYREKIDNTINQTSKTEGEKQIFIVDDMPEILAAVSSVLKGHYRVFPFTDGNEALKALDAKHQPDAFILDIEMPKMDGFKLAKKIRSNPKYKDTPILFLTGSSTKGNLVKSLQYKPATFIVKPVNKDIIVSRLSGFLKKAAESGTE